MSIDQLQLFSEFLREHYAKSTRYSYTSRTRVYLRTLEADADFTEASVRAYLSRMADRCRPSACHSAHAAIRRFGAWLVETGVLAVNPVAPIKAPRLGKPHRETPTEAQVTAMLEACERIHHPYRKTLARAVVFTLVMSAVRRGELLALKLGDVDILEGTIDVRHGKGDKARTIRPAPACIDALRDYLAIRPACDLDRLFLLRKGLHLGDEGLRTLLRDVASIAGLAGCKAILPHGQRHACATRMRNKGTHLEEISEFLGHADVNTTILYLHRPTERAKEIAAFTDPRMDTGHTPAPPPPDQPVRRPPLRLVDGGAQHQSEGTQ